MGIADFLNIISKPKQPVVGSIKNFVPTAPVRPPLDIQKYLKAIAYNETRGVTGMDPYKSKEYSGKPELGDALGRYRVTRGELNTHSKRYLGRNVSTQEFLSNPKLQDEYVSKQAQYRYDQGYTPQQAADFHRAGTGILEKPEGAQFFPGSTKHQNQGYVDSFNLIYNQ